MIRGILPGQCSSEDVQSHGTVGLTNDERGVSDLVGFVLTFAVIIAAVGIVSTFGVSSLNDIQQGEQLNNAERAFQILAENFNEIERGQAPRRTSEIDLREGSVLVANDSTFTVGVRNTPFNVTVPLQRIQYSQDNTIIAYENGATLRADRISNGSTLRDRPDIVCTEERAIISIVQLDADLDRQLGSGKVQVTGVEQNETVLYPLNRSGRHSATYSDQVNVTLDNRFLSGWDNYFSREESNWSRVNRQKWTCDGVSHVYVRQTTINVTFVR